MRYLVLLLVLLAGSASAQIHELKEFEKIADQLGPYPHDLYHYCEEAYDDSVSTAVPDGWYWTLVTDGYGSLEKYSVNVEKNAINESMNKQKSGKPTGNKALKGAENKYIASLNKLNKLK